MTVGRARLVQYGRWLLIAWAVSLALALCSGLAMGIWVFVDAGLGLPPLRGRDSIFRAHVFYPFVIVGGGFLGIWSLFFFLCGLAVLGPASVVAVSLMGIVEWLLDRLR